MYLLACQGYEVAVNNSLPGRDRTPQVSLNPGEFSMPVPMQLLANLRAALTATTFAAVLAVAPSVRADTGSVADMVRGLPVEKALNVLQFCPKKGATIIRKVLESAIGNAEHNDGADIDELKVARIFVERGASLRRFTARAKGRGNRITKPTCHIYVTVGDGRI